MAAGIVDPKMPNLGEDFVHFSKKFSITSLFETFCINTPYMTKLIT